MTFRTLVLSTACLAFTACDKNSAEERVSTPTTTVQPVDEGGESAALSRSASAHGASIFFVAPSDGETLRNPIQIEFGSDGMQIVKAGVNQSNSGHHHLLIDTDLPNFELPIPADEHHLHFGDGRTTTKITLPPGEHRLQMILGDHQHLAHEPPLVSQSVTITVE